MRPIKPPAVAAVFLLLAGATQAHASAGISCRAQDALAALGVQAAFTRGLGGGMINFSAELKVLLKNAPPDFRAFKFEQKDVSQSWWYGPDFRLQLYRERAGELPFGAVNLVVQAREGKGRDEGSYRGTYRLEISFKEKKTDAEAKTLPAQGKVECSSE
jgi:hypothetical protein